MILVVTCLTVATFFYFITKRPLPIVVWVSFTLALTYYNPTHIQQHIDASTHRLSYKANWGSTFINRNSHIFTASNVSNLQSYLKSSNDSVRVAGSMHSYSPLVKSQNIIDVHHLNKILMYNGTHVRCQAGATIGKVQKFLSQYDKTLRGIGSITAQTVSGGFSTSLSGIERRGFSEFATAAKTLDYAGNTVEWSDLYYLRDSMGLLGVLIELEFEVFDNRQLDYTSERKPLSELSSSHADAFDSVLTFYSDFSSILTVSYTLHNESDPIQSVKSMSKITRELIDYVVIPITFWVPMHALHWAFESSIVPDGPQQLATIGHDAPVHGAIFIDYRIPIDKCASFVEAMPKQDGFIRIKILNARSDACLANKESVCKVELYVPQHKKVKTYEELARQYGGYSHWGKLYKGNITKQFETFECYSDFENIRRQQDPVGRFKNDYLKGHSPVYWHGGYRLWAFHILIPLFFGVQIWTCAKCCRHKQPRGYQKI